MAGRDNIDHDALKRSMGRALANGAKHPTVCRVQADYSGNCTDKRFVVRATRPTKKADESPGEGTFLVQETWIRCRKCRDCLYARSRQWAIRAEKECRQSILTWMGTLTLSPDEQSRVSATACVDYKAFNALGVFEQLSLDDQFAWKVGVIGSDITRYKMQLRNRSGSHLRTLVVAEPHVSGAPHFHMLVHEHDTRGTLTREILREEWKLGFTKWNIIDGHADAARYVCKYIAKSGAVRPRASTRYGQISLDIAKAFKCDDGDLATETTP